MCCTRSFPSPSYWRVRCLAVSVCVAIKKGHRVDWKLVSRLGPPPALPLPAADAEERAGGRAIVRMMGAAAWFCRLAWRASP